MCVHILIVAIIHLCSIPSSSAFLPPSLKPPASSKIFSAASEVMPSNVQTLVDQAKSLFDSSFGADVDKNLPNYCVSAPGRVNLIGEHTDYTGGYVLPLAIGFNTVGYGCGSVVKKDSSESIKCRIVSTNNPVAEFHVSPSLEASTGSNKWVNYVQGVVLQYLPDLKEDETFIFALAIVGDVPLGSGLSSSASLEVATACEGCTLVREATKDGTGSCEGKLLLLDCRSLDYREVSMGGENASSSDAPVLVITNSNVKHDLGDGEYPVRVRQCKEATDILTKMNPSIQSLRDATMKDVEAAAKSAGLEGVLLQRARHVVSENERTVKTADALEKGDWETVGKLMNASHTSMRDDYEVSCEEIDVLVDLAQTFGDGVFGSRLTGGGFGGCTVTLVKKDSAQQLIEYLKTQYEAKTGTKCVCFETAAASGAKAIDL
eukprot:scaffold14368_cov214-Skeletonema_dohrnii-CCMP3373.AAC.5